MPHVLLTGSAGHLGRTLAALLRANGYAVTGFDIQQGSDPSDITADVRDCGIILKTRFAHNPPDIIIHTASLHAPHVGIRPDQDFIDINITAVKKLLDWAVTANIKKIIYTSTTSVYGHAMEPMNDKAMWVDESLPPIPRDIYDTTKLAAESLCREYSATYKLPVICLRTSRFWDEPEHLKAIYRFYRGVDVRDAAAAHLLAVTNLDIAFDIFNISAQSPFTKDDLGALYHHADEVMKRLAPGVEEQFRRRGWKLPQRIDRVYDITKARTLLGYRPVFNYSEFLAGVDAD